MGSESKTDERGRTPTTTARIRADSEKLRMYKGTNSMLRLGTSPKTMQHASSSVMFLFPRRTVITPSGHCWRLGNAEK